MFFAGEILEKVPKNLNFVDPGVHEKFSESYFDLGFVWNSPSYFEIIYFSPPEVTYDPSVDLGKIPLLKKHDDMYCLRRTIGRKQR